MATTESQLNHSALDPPSLLCFSFTTLLSLKRSGRIKVGAAPPLVISESKHLGSEVHYLTPSAPLQGHKPQGHIPAAHLCQGKTLLTQHAIMNSPFFLFPQKGKGVI